MILQMELYNKNFKFSYDSFVVKHDCIKTIRTFIEVLGIKALVKFSDQ